MYLFFKFIRIHFGSSVWHHNLIAVQWFYGLKSVRRALTRRALTTKWKNLRQGHLRKGVHLRKGHLRKGLRRDNLWCWKVRAQCSWSSTPMTTS